MRRVKPPAKVPEADDMPDEESLRRASEWLEELLAHGETAELNVAPSAVADAPKAGQREPPAKRKGVK
jgi:hypothetical protein